MYCTLICMHEISRSRKMSSFISFDSMIVLFGSYTFLIWVNVSKNFNHSWSILAFFFWNAFFDWNKFVQNVFVNVRSSFSYTKILRTRLNSLVINRVRHFTHCKPNHHPHPISTTSYTLISSSQIQTFSPPYCAFHFNCFDH